MLSATSPLVSEWNRFTATSSGSITGSRMRARSDATSASCAVKDGAGAEVLIEALAIAEPERRLHGRGGIGGAMLFGIPAGKLAMLVAALIVAGLVAGFLAGLLGIGGGGVLVPVLSEVFRILDVDPAIRMHMVLGTTLAIIAPTSLKSFAGHRAKGSADLALLKRVTPWIVLGVVIGILTAKASSGTFLKWVWVIAAGLVALKMALGREDWRLGNELPPRPWPEIAAGVIGFISTLMSIGGATFVVPLLTLYGRPILSAVATASGIGPLSRCPASSDLHGPAGASRVCHPCR